MKITTVAAAALSLALLAACDRAEQRSAPAASGSTAAPQSQNTPANMGAPSAAEKQEGSNPVQGQVDPKQSAQRKDFQHPDTGGK